MHRETRSFMMENCTWYSGPVSGNQPMPYTLFSRSTMAFLMIFWQSDTENSLELRL